MFVPKQISMEFRWFVHVTSLIRYVELADLLKLGGLAIISLDWSNLSGSCWFGSSQVEMSFIRLLPDKIAHISVSYQLWPEWPSWDDMSWNHIMLTHGTYRQGQFKNPNQCIFVFSSKLFGIYNDTYTSSRSFLNVHFLMREHILVYKQPTTVGSKKNCTGEKGQIPIICTSASHCLMVNLL